MRARKPPRIEGWFRKLQNGRVEIFLKAERVPDHGDRKIRASGPEDEMFELVDWFEEKTGLRVESPKWRRVRTGPRPMEGQMALTMGELPSERPTHDATVASDGEPAS